MTDNNVMKSFCNLFVNNRVSDGRINVAFNTSDNDVPAWAENGWLEYTEQGSVNGNRIYRIKISEKGKDILTFNEL